VAAAIAASLASNSPVRVPPVIVAPSCPLDCGKNGFIATVPFDDPALSSERQTALLISSSWQSLAGKAEILLGSVLF
jgi:hypothetical protein